MERSIKDLQNLEHGFCFLVVYDCWLIHINLMQWQDFVLLLVY